jgi:antitoxin VapB
MSYGEFIMVSERHVRLFKNGRNQALRIPREFELPGEEAIIRKEGHRLIVEPVKTNPGLTELLATLESLDEDFPKIEDPPATDDDIDL